MSSFGSRPSPSQGFLSPMRSVEHSVSNQPPPSAAHPINANRGSTSANLQCSSTSAALPNLFDSGLSGYSTHNSTPHTATNAFHSSPPVPIEPPTQLPLGSHHTQSYDRDRLKPKGKSTSQPQVDTTQQDDCHRGKSMTFNIKVPGLGVQLKDFEVQVIHALVHHLTDTHGKRLSPNEIENTIHYMLGADGYYSTTWVVDYFSLPPKYEPHTSQYERHVRDMEKAAELVKARQSFWVACAAEAYSGCLEDFNPENPLTLKTQSGRQKWRSRLEAKIRKHVETKQLPQPQPQQSRERSLEHRALTSDGEPERSAESAQPPRRRSQQVSSDIIQSSQSSSVSNDIQPLPAKQPTEHEENHPQNVQDSSGKVSLPAPIPEARRPQETGQCLRRSWSPFVTSIDQITDAMLDEAFDEM